tara:strand:+ start:528 stop:995 length:468 start_codon:yes stop_codon:yes gene_type:complete
MDINFSIRKVDDLKDLRLLRDFLHMHDLGYPRYDEWVDTVCIPDIEDGYKTAVIALHEDIIVGDILWQPHKEVGRVVEPKNLRIHPDLRERGLAYFLMKQCEVESRGDFSVIIADFPEDQLDMNLFLLRYGFRVLYSAHLYSENRRETIVTKDIN